MELLITTGIGSVHKRTGEILAFIFNWSTIFILQPTGIAVVTLTFSQYLVFGIMNGNLFYCQCNVILQIFRLDHDPSEKLIKIISIVTLLILIGINSISVQAANRLNIVFVICTTKKPLGIALAFYSGLWAYDGWNCLNAVTEELKNPKSALGGCNGSLFMSGRYCMVGARYGYLPEVFACIQKQRLTPLPAIVLEGILSMVYCIPSNIQSLIEFFSFVAWMFYGLTFVATLCCKFTKKEVDRVISVPIPLVIIIILIFIYLVISPVISNPNIGFLVALILILFGLIFYYPFVYRKIELKLIQQINAFLKRCFQLEKCDINMS
ncbi:unnamed protein product [Rotaria sordida]|uniref:Uncharacterized protein n=1 Tax=Rotaria sordida TaxID=392033 RepID=A0A815D720_9BILA|nr:unnamed protein product [Rotaria sordida]